MKYFYYGTKQENAKTPTNSYHNMGNGFGEEYSMMQDEELVIEEDTIYEIDQECEACRQKRQQENT